MATLHSAGLLLLLLALWASVNGQDCAWDKDVDFPKDSPLILDEDFQLVLPVMEGEIRMVRLSAGSKVTLACPGNEIVNLGRTTVEASCAGGILLAIDGTEWEMRALGCSDKVKESIHRELGYCGSEDLGVLHSVGFEIDGPSSYYELIRVCFEPELETTLYTEHILHGANIAAKDIDTSRPSFKSAGFFSVSMNTVYAQATQLKLMTNLLGDADLANTIIDPHKQLYFAKGHMSPDADFVTTMEEDATYYFINAVPQWQAFNNGNWKYLEFATRDLAKKHGTDLTIYSGGWGILELEDINNNPVQIYLGLSQEKTVVPAPAVTWKVVYEESSNRAAAIVGVNNPHITSVPELLCPDLCSSLTWIDFDVEDMAHGYTYCCTVEDLRAVIPHVPDLGSVVLLTE
ncbi:salivary protein Tsal1-like [Panulirus ornatus]|uniref:salivary protein Tsal1-like n=1 Tax=Panulirus ornatus TaxID=150431 RepID=UPI003A894F95